MSDVVNICNWKHTVECKEKIAVFQKMNGMVPHVQIGVFTNVIQLLRIKGFLLLPLEEDSASKMIREDSFLGLLKEQNTAQANVSLWRNTRSRSINTVPQIQLKYQCIELTWSFFPSSGCSQLHPRGDRSKPQPNQRVTTAGFNSFRSAAVWMHLGSLFF